MFTTMQISPRQPFLDSGSEQPHGPKPDSQAVPTADEANKSKEQQLAEETALQTRQEIDRILTRRPLSGERIEEISAAAKEFYRQAMERKKKQQRKKITMLLSLMFAGVATWWFFA
ncbi:hypothetical protein QBC43DRAFT_303445 [Cladorrhinum sp. PSN259]|nr:hypothetical protein QBC43DRAFT_303445 [Cladorrhinum sp. PSN259]